MVIHLQNEPSLNSWIKWIVNLRDSSEPIYETEYHKHINVSARLMIQMWQLSDQLQPRRFIFSIYVMIVMFQIQWQLNFKNSYAAL